MSTIIETRQPKKLEIFGGDGVPMHHLFDPDEWPIAYCGEDISDDPDCSDDCRCFVCPACDAVVLLNEREA